VQAELDHEDDGSFRDVLVFSCASLTNEIFANRFLAQKKRRTPDLIKAMRPASNLRITSGCNAFQDDFFEEVGSKERSLRYPVRIAETVAILIHELSSWLNETSGVNY